MKTRFLVPLTFLFLALLVLPVFAQGGPNTADPTTTPLEWYSSVGGIGLATAFVVSALKRVLGNVAALKDVPTFMYSVVVAGILTFICVKVLGTLPGDLPYLMWQTVYNAAIASGVYGWVTTGSTTMQVSAAKVEAAKLA